MLKKSVLLQLARNSIIAMGSLMFLVLGIYFFRGMSESEASLESSAKSIASELAISSENLIWNLDDSSIWLLLKAKATNRDISSISLFDGESKAWKVIKLEDNTLVTLRTLEAPSGLTTLRTDYRESATLHSSRLPKAVVNVEITSVYKHRENIENALILSLFMVVAMAFVVLVYLVVWRRFRVRIDGMLLSMADFEAGNESSRMDPSGGDELGYFAVGFNRLADKIAKNNQEMLSEIKSRTEMLVETEKLAVLGSMVAGLAHELNTPIGNCVTINSWIKEQLVILSTKMKNNQLTKEDLELFLSNGIESTTISEANLDRTVSLIQSFKRLGKDQAIDEISNLDLHRFLQDTIASLQPTFKKFPHHLKLTCRSELSLTTNPNLLYQIIANLLTNAYRHAFGPDSVGTIEIEARKLGDRVKITISDNGKGMSSETESKAFIPFFTTARSEGGTGLGLAIVHSNMQKLHGQIELKTSPGEGTIFLLSFPEKIESFAQESLRKE